MDINHKVVKIETCVDSGLRSPKEMVIQEIDADHGSQPLLTSTKDRFSIPQQQLFPSIKDRFSIPSEKSKRKVQWVDWNGDKLAQTVEFIPSDVSDEDEDEDEEDSDSCACVIM